MPQLSKRNDKDEDKDCYEINELVLLTIMYTVLTGLYLTASTNFQYSFLGVITIILLYNTVVI